MLEFCSAQHLRPDPGDLYYLENLPEALDEPGEWYLSRAEGSFYYLPRPEERLEQSEVIAPVLSCLVRVVGAPEKGQFVEGVHWEGITFRHTEWSLPETLETGGSCRQRTACPAPSFWKAHADVPSKSASSSKSEPTPSSWDGAAPITESKHANSATWAQEESKSANPLSAPTPRNRPSGTVCRTASSTTAANCSPALLASGSDKVIVIACCTTQFTTSTTQESLSGGHGATASRWRAATEWSSNHVHHIGVRLDGEGPVLSDMGGIYTLGIQHGTVIRNNRWHDIAGYRYGGWGIYLDEGSSGILVENNWVYRTTHGGFHLHYGRENTVRNNVFAYGRDYQLQASRPEPHRRLLFERNIVLGQGAQWLAGGIDENLRFDYNLYWREDGSEIRFGNDDFAAWQARGQDTHSRIADPRFENPTLGDFRLRPDLPARALGFQPSRSLHSRRTKPTQQNPITPFRLVS